MAKLNIVIVLICCVAVFQNCQKTTAPSEYPDPTPYTLAQPALFPNLAIPTDNPMTEEGIALGRRLYYDPILDKDGARACANCHDITKAFTTNASNSLAHINLGWHSSFLWNGKVMGTLEDIMLFEVDVFFQSNLASLQANSEIAEMFGAAFGSNTVTSINAAKALSQFARIMISSNSKYDKAITPSTWVDLNDEETRGHDIFFSEKGDCFHCHGNYLFTDGIFHNNGLDANPAFGRSAITNNNLDVGKFRTPTLRNIELTAPYMHDGRYQTLEEVVDFYSTGIEFSTTIDPLMKNVNQGGLQLTTQEKSDLVAFLKTLTDTTFTTNQALTSPL